MKPYKIEPNNKSEYANQNAYLRAKKRVNELKGFYWHLVSYLAVNTFLIGAIVINSGLPNIWNFGTFSTAFFWGIGLAFHALRVFGKNLIFGKQWEERKIQDYIKKDKTHWQ